MKLDKLYKTLKIEIIFISKRIIFKMRKKKNVKKNYKLVVGEYKCHKWEII